MIPGCLIEIISNTAVLHDRPPVGSRGVYMHTEFDIGQEVCVVLISGTKFRVSARDIKVIQ